MISITGPSDVVEAGQPGAQDGAQEALREHSQKAWCTGKGLLEGLGMLDRGGLLEGVGVLNFPLMGIKSGNMLVFGKLVVIHSKMEKI